MLLLQNQNGQALLTKIKHSISLSDLHLRRLHNEHGLFSTQWTLCPKQLNDIGSKFLYKALCVRSGEMQKKPTWVLPRLLKITNDYSDRSVARKLPMKMQASRRTRYIHFKVYNVLELVTPIVFDLQLNSSIWESTDLMRRRRKCCWSKSY